MLTFLFLFFILQANGQEEIPIFPDGAYPNLVYPVYAPYLLKPLGPEQILSGSQQRHALQGIFHVYFNFVVLSVC